MLYHTFCYIFVIRSRYILLVAMDLLLVQCIIFILIDDGYYHYLVAVTRCYGLICTSVTNFLRGYKRIFCGPLWIFAGHYGSVTHPSDVIVYAKTEIVGQHRHNKAILIVINFIIYKLFFMPPLGFELGLIKLKRRVASQLSYRRKYEQRG